MLTALLRLLDEEHSYFERRSPIVRTPRYSRVQESLIGQKYSDSANASSSGLIREQESSCYFLLGAQPYSRSRSHRIILNRLDKLRQFLHEAIITSPIGIVPRGLEIMYPPATTTYGYRQMDVRRE